MLHNNTISAGQLAKVVFGTDGGTATASVAEYFDKVGLEPSASCKFGKGFIRLYPREEALNHAKELLAFRQKKSAEAAQKTNSSGQALGAFHRYCQDTIAALDRINERLDRLEKMFTT